MMESLTKKEALAVEYFLAGDNQTEATLKAYNCKDRNSARSLACRVFGKQRVSLELAERQKTLQQKLVDNNLRFIDLVEKYAPRDAIAQKLAENIKSKDTRVSSAAIDQYLKIRGEYAPTRAIEAKWDMNNNDSEGKVYVLKEGDTLEEKEILVRSQDIVVKMRNKKETLPEPVEAVEEVKEG